MIRFSKDQIRRAAQDCGLARLDSLVFCQIGYWEQIEGGLRLGEGERWRWRTYKEIGSDIGYAPKSVGRAMRRLMSLELLEVRLIRNPTRPGETVNAYRLCSKGRGIIETLLTTNVLNGQTAGSPRASPTSPGCDMPKVPVEHSKKQKTDQFTNNVQKQRERAREDLGQVIEKCFGKEAYDWVDIADHEQWFWTGYSTLIRMMFGKKVGAFNEKRREWMRAYLFLFKEDELCPAYAAFALGRSVLDWENVRLDMVLDGNTRFGLDCSDYPQPYDLGVYGHVIFNQELEG